MKQRALIVESTARYRDNLAEIFSGVGVECVLFSTGSEALEARHDKYDFMLVARTLDDITGEIFLQRYRTEVGQTEALAILLTSENVSDVMYEANQAGYKLVFNKNNLEQLQNIVIKILNTRTLELGAHVLYVEDSTSVSNVVLKLFNESKATIDHASTLAEVNSRFASHDYDLVVTDYYLRDGETGDDVISLVRQSGDEGRSSTPILVISGETDKTKRTSLLRNGANDFILKPYDSNELLVRSSNLIKNHRLLQQARQQRQQLLKMALTDQLTALYNRHSLSDLAPKYISNAHRHKTELSLLVIDLDHFKDINDTHGHGVGDIVLKEVAGVLRNACRTEDIVARFGGEEFLMLLSNCDVDNAIKISEKLREAIEASKPNGLSVTASIGVAQLLSGESFEELFKRADDAVYEAKAAGRNRVVA